MLRDKPRFPAFDEWTRMGEQEQDALLARIEVTRRRRRQPIWLACCASLVALLSALLATRS
jgi:hypothetical protein